ncbi:TerC/Alx family metal homeostasis membrane protein [Cellulomonas sp. URHE0023]|uniref:TerC/Alx family metal homeostasis membrane protein n=1 Tax=Cellulomonas sp. URHE0023 TaxID=1380354 RepID=UPI000551F989|nr:TerC/Alx family metal homeostasis membrane protein [Cellulomonas sp. URHE0023]
MDVTPIVWAVSLGLVGALLVVDVAVVGRRPHIPTTSECVRYLAIYIGLAVLFGLFVGLAWGADFAGQFYAGWITEYSLSVDNLFVFLLIMSKFAVPRQYQQTALLVGIILALVLRGIFIWAGAAAIGAFSWVFYLFGAFLVWTAVKVGREGESDDDEFKPPLLLRLVLRWFPSTDEYHGVKLTVVEGGKRLMTPMLVVLVALGATDLLFAFDSIPAIFGLTSEPYLVLMANLFALMGLRQLYFLLGDLLKRLVYLNIGLAVLLGFIGVKLILHALSENELPFINGGEPVPWVPEVPTWMSLAAIVLILGVTTIASLWKVRRDARAAELDAPGPQDDVPLTDVGPGDDPLDSERVGGQDRVELRSVGSPEDEQGAGRAVDERP